MAQPRYNDEDGGYETDAIIVSQRLNLCSYRDVCEQDRDGKVNDTNPTRDSGDIQIEDEDQINMKFDKNAHIQEHGMNRWRQRYMRDSPLHVHIYPL